MLNFDLYGLEPSYHNVTSCKMHVQLHFDSCFLRRFRIFATLQPTSNFGPQCLGNHRIWGQNFFGHQGLWSHFYTWKVHFDHPLSSGILAKIIMGKNKFLCWLVGLWWLTTFSTIFQLYPGCHFIGEGY